MKYLFLICCFALNTISNINANTAQQNSNTIYAIQLVASSQPNLDKFNAVKRYGYLYTASTNTEVQKILLGSYPTKSAAKTVLSKVKAKGFKDAYIIPFPLAEESMIYSVQFISYAYASTINWEKFNYMGDVKIDASSGKVKLLTGIFYDQESARAHANTLKGEGYPGAFIRHINEGILLYPHNNHVPTNYTANSATSSSETTTVSSNEYSDPYKSPIYTQLTESEKEMVVYLDGVLSIRQNGSFIPLAKYTPMTSGSSSYIELPQSVNTHTTATQSAVVHYGDDMTPKGISTTSGMNYKIQITAVQYFDPLRFSSVENLGTVNLETNDKGINRVMLGTFVTEEDAKSALQNVKDNGFNQAYIVEYKDEIRGSKQD